MAYSILEGEDIYMGIIERLMNKEYRYGDPEDSRLGKEAAAIVSTLSSQLDEGEKRLLENLLDIEIRRTILVQEDAFTIGVCTGVMFMCEVCKVLDQDK